MTLQSRLATLIADIGADMSLLLDERIELIPFYKTGALSVVTSDLEIPILDSYEFVDMVGRVGTVPTGSSIILDVFKGTGAGASSTIWTTTGNRPTIAASAKESTSSGAPNTTTFADGDYIQFRIAQVGSTITGSDLAAILRLRRI
jgi:hypothetical protein